MSRSDDQETIKNLLKALGKMEDLIEAAQKPPEKGCPMNIDQYNTAQYAPASVTKMVAVSGGSRNRVRRGAGKSRGQPKSAPARGRGGDEEDVVGSGTSDGDETAVEDIGFNMQAAGAELMDKKAELIEACKKANLHEKSEEEANAQVEAIIAHLKFAEELTEQEVTALQEATEKMVASQKKLIAEKKPFVALSLFIHIAGVWALKATGTIDALLSYVGDSYRSLAGITPLGDSCDLDNFWNIFNWADDCQEVSQYTTIFWLTIFSTIGTIAAYKYPEIIPGIDTSNPFKIILSLAKASTLKLAELFSKIDSFQTAAATVITWPFQKVMNICRWNRVPPPAPVDLAASGQSPQGSPQGSPQVSPQGSPQVSPRGSPQVSPQVSPRGTPQGSPQVSPRGTPVQSGDEGDSDDDEGDMGGGRRRKGKRRQTKKRKGRGRKSPTRKRGRKGKGKKKNKAKSRKQKPAKKRSTRKRQRGGGDCPCNAPVAKPVMGGKKKGRGKKTRGKKRNNKRRTYKK